MRFPPDHFQAQKRLDKIKPLLTEFVDSELIARGSFRDVFQTAVGTLAQHGLWNDADALAEIHRKAIPENPNPYHQRAPLLAAMGEVEEYRRIRGVIISRFSKLYIQYPDQTEPKWANQIVKDCLILPLSGVEWRVGSVG